MCDTVVVVERDRVLFAKNSDRDPNEAQLLDWRPRRRYRAGESLQCTWMAIAQVEVTHAVLLSRPFWMWGAEIGANEHGVAIGNEAVFTRQPYAASGLTGMDLVRLGLERGATAAAAVRIITELLERHGQGGGCGHEDRGFTYHNSFIVADPSEAYVLETASRRWAMETVSGVRSISNRLTISGFARAHSDFIKSTVSRAATRRSRTTQLAARASGPGDLMRLLRDHGEGRKEPAYALLNGGMDAPCMHAGGLVTSSQTTASWVAELRPDGVRHWVTGTAAPCTSIFKPVRVDQPLELSPNPTDCAEQSSLWWRHERLHRVTMEDPRRLLPLFAGERDELEAEWLREPPDPEEAFVQADALLARWTQEVEAHREGDRRPPWTRFYWRRRAEMAGMDCSR